MIAPDTTPTGAAANEPELRPIPGCPPALFDGQQPMNPTTLQKTQSTIRFTTKLLRPNTTETDVSTTFLTLPKNANAQLPPRPTLIVEGTINGFPFRSTLESNADGSRSLSVNKALQDAVSATVGDSMSIEITRVDEEPEIRIPPDWRNSLEATPTAHALWQQITPMARRDWILWIISAKQEETRARRIETGCDMLASGKRRPCCMPGINWRIKDSDVTSEETWLPLPSTKSRASAKSAK